MAQNGRRDDSSVEEIVIEKQGKLNRTDGHYRSLIVALHSSYFTVQREPLITLRGVVIFTHSDET